jgi:phage baseplate assembly protein W
MVTQVTTTLQAYMKDLIRTAILYFEPRIILDDVTLLPEPEEGLGCIRVC